MLPTPKTTRIDQKRPRRATPPSIEKGLKLWVVMNRAVRAIEDQLRRQVEPYGLTMTEFAVLEALFHRGPLPIGEIGNRVLRTSGSMTYVIDKLEKRDLLRRTACPTDRRSVYAELTEAGSLLIRDIFPEHAELINTLAGSLTADEVAEATRLIKTLGLGVAESEQVIDTPAP